MRASPARAKSSQKSSLSGCGPGLSAAAWERASPAAAKSSQKSRLSASGPAEEEEEGGMGRVVEEESPSTKRVRVSEATLEPVWRVEEALLRTVLERARAWVWMSAEASWMGRRELVDRLRDAWIGNPY